MYQNIPKLTDEVTLTLRGLCQKRAICIWRVLDNAKKAGIEDLSWIWQSIREYGYDTAQNLEKSMENPGDLNEFANHFGVGLDRDIYEMETVEQTDERFRLNFHYCPFVEKWRALGIPEEDMPELCDLTMQGDHGVGEVFEKKYGIKFTLGGTIADGNDVCDLLFEKIKK